MLHKLVVALLLSPLALLAADTAVMSQVAQGLSAPTAIVSLMDGSGRLLVTEHGGTVRAVVPATGEVSLVLNIADRVWQREGFCCDERGLLGIAAPRGSGPKNHLFLSYVDRGSHVIVSRFSMDPGTGIIDPASEVILQKLLHEDINHFGGAIAFHPSDGLLYWSIGDGSSGDNVAYAQDPKHPFGKVLRFDAYAGPGAPLEIYAIGFRNPWRFSFDRATGDLFIGDVGENTYEEINLVPSGTPAGKLNFGWGIMEGFFCYEMQPCSTDGLAVPIVALDRDQACSVTAGETYRGTKYADWQGRFIYADFCMGTIWSAHREESGWVVNTLIEKPDVAISTFGLDEAGEIYFADYIKGVIHRLEQPAPRD